MSQNRFSFSENGYLYTQLEERAKIFKFDPVQIYPWWLRPCTVKVLLLTDGGLDFGLGDFGLSTFVSILQNETRRYVKFELTLAHRSSSVTDAQVQKGAPNIARSIKGFRFDNADHFSISMYDQVWLFGGDSSSNYLSEAELKLITTFMNNGGGVFATGDHGSLGRGLCSAVPRVRSMRLWDNISGEVGMDDSRRNDTNRPGHDAGSQFDDQSDDIPQTISPKLYFNRVSPFFKESYPHPLLCGKLGKITVLPDHPHEGECIEPSNLTLKCIDGSPEYPLGIRPEIIARSTVLEGSKAGTKAATQAHSFGAISAYDGHRANVGRVVTDATWHHYLNINLVGELVDSPRDAGQPEHVSKNYGFLFSAAGEAHFAQIKEYYINIAVWISRPSNHSCFHSRFIWDLVYNHRVMEATMNDPLIKLDSIGSSVLYSIGSHATDVLGRSASQCRKLIFTYDLIRPIFPKLVDIVDPWLQLNGKQEIPSAPWLNLEPMLNMAVGGALLNVRDKLTKTTDSIEKDIPKIAQEGAKRGLELGFKAFSDEISKYSSVLKY